MHILYRLIMHASLNAVLHGRLSL